jgi:hypothetical protein
MKLYVFPQRDIVGLRMEQGTLRLVVPDYAEVLVEETESTLLTNGYQLVNFLTQQERIRQEPPMKRCPDCGQWDLSQHDRTNTERYPWWCSCPEKWNVHLGGSEEV